MSSLGFFPRLMEALMGTVTTIGLDLAKNIFQVHGVDDVGNVVLRRTLRRKQVADFFAQLPPCLVAMESCSTSQFWARKLAELGHQPRLIPPQFVKPYLMTNKNDANDAAAICEAVRRPQMRFVPLKTRDQQSTLAPYIEFGRAGLRREPLVPIKFAHSWPRRGSSYRKESARYSGTLASG